MTRPERRDQISVPRTGGRQRVRSRDWPRRPRRDPHMRVTAQLLDLAGPAASVVEASFRPWASATFLGARHRVTIRFTGPDHCHKAEIFASTLPEAEFSVSGHIVADACVDAWKTSDPLPTGSTGLAGDRDGRVEETLLHLSVLTVEDW